MGRRSERFAKPALDLILLLAAVATGCQVRQPGSVETALVQGFKRTVRVGGKADANPLPADAENIHAGQENLSHYCVVCHGLDGQNTGAVCRSDVTAAAAADFGPSPAV